MFTFGLEQIFLELGQLPGAVKRLRIHEVRYVCFEITMLSGMQVQHELGQCPVQPGNTTAHHRKPGMGQPGSRFKIQAVQGLAQRDMIPGLEIESTGLTPGPDLDVVVLAFSGGYVFVRQVRNAGQKGIQLLLQPAEGFLGLGALLLQILHFLQKRLDILAGGFGLTDGFGPLILLALQRLGAHLKLTATLFQLLEGSNIEFEILDGQPAGNLFGLGTDAFGIEHGSPGFSGFRSGFNDPPLYPHKRRWPPSDLRNTVCSGSGHSGHRGAGAFPQA